MDIYCPKCGEPWDTDTFHDIAAERDITYTDAVRAFQADGCAATGWCDPCTPVSTARTSAAALLYELLGDDVDGAASELADWEYLGVLD